MINPMTFESEGKEKNFTYAKNDAAVLDVVLSSRTSSEMTARDVVEQSIVHSGFANKHVEANSRGSQQVYVTDFSGTIEEDGQLHIEVLRGYIVGRYFEVSDETIRVSLSETRKKNGYARIEFQACGFSENDSGVVFFWSTGLVGQAVGGGPINGGPRGINGAKNEWVFGRIPIWFDPSSFPAEVNVSYEVLGDVISSDNVSPNPYSLKNDHLIINDAYFGKLKVLLKSDNSLNVGDKDFGIWSFNGINYSNIDETKLLELVNVNKPKVIPQWINRFMSMGTGELFMNRKLVDKLKTQHVLSDDVTIDDLGNSKLLGLWDKSVNYTELNLSSWKPTAFQAVHVLSEASTGKNYYPTKMTKGKYNLDDYLSKKTTDLTKVLEQLSYRTLNYLKFSQPFYLRNFDRKGDPVISGYVDPKNQFIARRTNPMGVVNEGEKIQADVRFIIDDIKLNDVHDFYTNIHSINYGNIDEVLSHAEKDNKTFLFLTENYNTAFMHGFSETRYAYIDVDASIHSKVKCTIFVKSSEDQYDIPDAGEVVPITTTVNLDYDAPRRIVVVPLTAIPILSRKVKPDGEITISSPKGISRDDQLIDLLKHNRTTETEFFTNMISPALFSEMVDMELRTKYEDVVKFVNMSYDTLIKKLDKSDFRAFNAMEGVTQLTSPYR